MAACMVLFIQSRDEKHRLDICSIYNTPVLCYGFQLLPKLVCFRKVVLEGFRSLLFLSKITVGVKRQLPTSKNNFFLALSWFRQCV